MLGLDRLLSAFRPFCPIYYAMATRGSSDSYLCNHETNGITVLNLPLQLFLSQAHHRHTLLNNKSCKQINTEKEIGTTTLFYRNHDVSYMLENQAENTK